MQLQRYCFLLIAIAAAAAAQSAKTPFPKGELLWSPDGACAKPSKTCKPLFLVSFHGDKPLWSGKNAPPERRLSFMEVPLERVLTPQVRQMLGSRGVKLSGSLHGFEIPSVGKFGMVDVGGGTMFFVEKNSDPCSCLVGKEKEECEKEDPEVRNLRPPCFGQIELPGVYSQGSCNPNCDRCCEVMLINGFRPPRSIRASGPGPVIIQQRLPCRRPGNCSLSLPPR